MNDFEVNEYGEYNTERGIANIVYKYEVNDERLENCIADMINITAVIIAEEIEQCTPIGKRFVNDLCAMYVKKELPYNLIYSEERKLIKLISDNIIPPKKKWPDYIGFINKICDSYQTKQLMLCTYWECEFMAEYREYWTLCQELECEFELMPKLYPRKNAIKKLMGILYFDYFSLIDRVANGI